MTGVISRFSIVWLLLAGVEGNAAVTELWRNGLINSPGVARDLRAAAVDGAGNTIAGGLVSSGVGDFSGSGLVVKFDAAGKPLWEYRTEANATEGIEALSLDSEGNAIITVRVYPERLGPYLAVIKVSPDGTELWRGIETNLVQGVFTPGDYAAAVQVDSRDNVIITALATRQVGVGPRRFGVEQFVSKYDPDGRLLWRTMLPGYGYVLFDAGHARSLAVTEKNDLLVVGGYYGSYFPSGPHDPYDAHGFITRLSKHGRIEWWTEQRTGPVPNFYSSVIANGKGTTAAGGEYYGGATFSRRGELLQVHPQLTEVLATTRDDGFLGLRPGYLTALDETGSTETWRFPLAELMRFWGVVPDGGNGWIVAGSLHSPVYYSRIQFIGLNEGGEERWQSELIGLPVSGDMFGYGDVFLLRAPDGTLRIVGDLGGTFEPTESRGITVTAFGIQADE